MEEKKKNYMILVGRTDGSNNYTIGVECFCSKCGAKCWLSDSSVRAIKEQLKIKNLDENPPLIVCTVCGIADMLNPKAKIQPLTDEQHTEIKDLIKKERNEGQ